MRRLIPVFLAALALAGAAEMRADRLGSDQLLVWSAPGTTLEATQLEVVEDGVARAVGSIERLDEPWRIVLYIDQLLLEPAVYRSALLDLAEQAKRLTGLGSVEIVLAGERVTRTLPPTTDPLALDEALQWLLVRETTEGGQIALRSDFIEANLADEEPADADSALAALRATEIGAAMRASIEDEGELLHRQRRNLLSWLSDQEAGGPKAIVLVTSGLDLRPADFYRTLVAQGPWREAAVGLPDPEVSPSLEEISQALAVYGWTVVSYSPPNRGDGLLAEDPGAPDPDKEDQVETVLQDGRLVDRTVATVDPRKVLDRLRKRDAPGETYVARLLSPHMSLQRLALDTGGEVVTERTRLATAFERLGAARMVRFETGASGLRTVTPRWQAGEGPDLRSRGWVSDSTPEVVSAQRARQYLIDGFGEGDVYVTAAVQFDESDGRAALVLEVETEDLGTADQQPMRVTVAVGEDQVSGIVHQTVDLAQAEPSVNDAARFVLPVDLPDSGEPVVVVFVEELASGRWGGTFASMSVASADLGDPLDVLLPAPKAVHLMAPDDVMVVGETTFETIVSQERVKSVRFVVDGSPVAADNQPPFSVTVDLGRLPDMHRIEAIAYDVNGAELGRDLLTVNAGLGNFRVRILRPGNTRLDDGEPMVGPVEIEARVETPRGGDLKRVEFYWKDRLVATRFAPPYVQRVTVPSEDSSGFVRVVGHLGDGEIAEDVVFVNSPGEIERLEVDLVELYVVVTDKKGRPVRGLGRESFQVLEEGVEQDLADFGDASDRPLTVGLAIDSSASMFIKLPEVQEAAATFVRGLRSRQDRAFVVGFGGEPQLARDTTSDMGRVMNGLYGLKPDGQTAFWKAVVYSLVQLQGAGGKKALIVFSDGADEDQDFSYRTALEFARRVGAPIYFIVSNDEIYRTAGKSLTVRGFLGRLNKMTAEVGGRVFLTKVTDDLESIYGEIDRELRSQYLLSYYTQDLGGSRWRRVTVEVDEPGAEARTLAGYFR